MINHIIELGLPWDKRLCTQACKMSCSDVLRWVLSQNIIPLDVENKRLTCAACVNGSEEILEILGDNGLLCICYDNSIEE